MNNKNRHMQDLGVIILAGGFGRRTAGVLKELPKLLIKTNEGKTIFDHLIDDLANKLHFQKIYLITNDRYYGCIKEAADNYTNIDIQVVSDNTKTNEDRLGALKDLLFVYEKITDKMKSYLVLPSDYFYWRSFSLKEFVDYSQLQNDDFCIVAYRAGKEKIKNRLGCIIAGNDNSITQFVEKPSEPQSDLAGSPFYLYRQKHFAMLENFINEGRNGDSPGFFVPYLVEKQERAKVFIVDKNMIDAGTPEDIERAKNY